MSNGSEENTSWEPDEEFYNSNQRSKEIRKACVPGVNALERLINDPQVREDPTERRRLESQLESVNGRLIELGITANMQKKRPRSDYQNDPVVAAEYLAGQLLEISQTNRGSDILDPGKLTKVENTFISEPGSLPESTTRFMAARSAIKTVRLMFGIKTEPIRSPEKDDRNN